MTRDTKYVLVTGANKGIGRAIVAALLDRRDDTHAFLGSRSAERGEKARSAIVADQPDAEARLEVVQLDVTDDDSVEQAAQTVASRLGSDSMYGIVNNAGISGRNATMEKVLDVNVRGPHRVGEAFMPLLDDEQGRVVNISSGSAPNFVAECSPERQQLLTDPEVTWAQIDSLIDEAVGIEEGDGDFEAAGLGESAYGMSKACLNAYTIALARNYPNLTINSCSPGFIETDLTRPMAEQKGVDPEEMGMKPPEEGTHAPLFLLLGDPEGHGWYYGSDAERSPLDRYRSPGDPPYTGD